MGCQAQPDFAKWIDFQKNGWDMYRHEFYQG